jgi:non-specific serine/threonine protein kinase
MSAHWLGTQPSVTGAPSWWQVLRALREARGVTQAGWATLLGYGERTIQRWERGESVPDATAEAVLVALCQEQSLFRAYGRGVLQGQELTAAALHALLAEARLRAEPAYRLPRFATRDEPASVPAVTDVDARLHNLPLQLTSFVGREQEVAELATLLQTTRLLTLTGAGGSGKTRLALQVAAALLDAFADGVWFVDLSGVADPSGIPAAVAQELGVQEHAGVAIQDSLSVALHPRQLLLVLDNFEQLLPTASVVARLLQAAPRLTMLVTSRAPLRIAGEQEYPLAPLALPAPDTDSLAAVAASPAVTLFVDRARSVRPDFGLTADSAAAVSGICTRLDGLPLAIELVAAQIRALPPVALLARLKQGLPLVSGGRRDAPARQQTLSAALDWSYQLLTSAEQLVFRYLAVFAGGWTLDVAEQVCAGESIEPEAVLDLLAQLIDHSLVNAREQAEGTRYHLLETVREFARDRLVAANELRTVQGRHAEAYLALAEAIAPAVDTADRALALRRLADDWDNLAAALQWASHNGPVELAVQLARALQPFWEARGFWSDGRRYVEAAVARLDGPLSLLTAEATCEAGVLALWQGDLGAAQARLADALAAYRALADELGIATCLYYLGDAMAGQGRHAEARTTFADSLRRFWSLGNLRGIGLVLSELGLLAGAYGEVQEAIALHELALAIWRRRGEPARVASTVRAIAMAIQFRGGTARACALYEESLTLYAELGDTINQAHTRTLLGILQAIRGEVRDALRSLREALRVYRQVGGQTGMAVCFEGIAGVMNALARPEQAARLLGASEALREALGVAQPRGYQRQRGQLVLSIRGALGENAFAELRAEGRVLTLEQAIAHGLEDVPESS